MATIFITRNIPESGIAQLKQKRHKVIVSPHDRVLTQKEIILMGKGSDALLCLLTDAIDGKVMDGIGPQLKVIANYAVGFDNIDLRAAQERNIVVTNTPGVLTETVAEHTIALLFALARRIVEADTFTRKGRYKGWAPMLFLGSDLTGKTLGIVGMGRIGAEIAKRMGGAFQMNVIYHDKVRNKEVEQELGVTYVSLNTLLKKSDVVSLHVPLLASTRHLISAKELQTMKKTSYLINTSRGPIIDEKALVEALKNKHIKGAALDVFEFEPKLAPGLSKLENIILTPHIASATEETRGKMADIATRNILAVLEGKTPPNAVRV
ncbi:MAG: D-glycerate dehydrogenase [bacterium]|nr:D-glycerate dehydrogenase [bacterium]